MSHGQTLFSNINLKYIFIQYITGEHLDTTIHLTHTQITTSLFVANVEKNVYSRSIRYFINDISYAEGRLAAGVGSQEYGR